MYGHFVLIGKGHAATHKNSWGLTDASSVPKSFSETAITCSDSCYHIKIMADGSIGKWLENFSPYHVNAERQFGLRSINSDCSLTKNFACSATPTQRSAMHIRAQNSRVMNEEFILDSSSRSPSRRSAVQLHILTCLGPPEQQRPETLGLRICNRIATFAFSMFPIRFLMPMLLHENENFHRGSQFNKTWGVPVLSCPCPDVHY